MRTSLFGPGPEKLPEYLRSVHPLTNNPEDREDASGWIRTFGTGAALPVPEDPGSFTVSGAGLTAYPSISERLCRAPRSGGQTGVQAH